MDEPAKTVLPPGAPTSATSKSTDLTGRTLGDFQLIRRIGQGGMGQVYLARQISLKRQVALKILKAELAANETSLRRFQQEAEAVARITHANIVQVYAIGAADGMHYMALEYVEGRNLRDYLNRKGPPELPIAMNIMRQVALALQRASELGFVHRDIKPENILLTRKGEVKVTDFGLSRCFAPDAEPLNITQSGVTMGTPLYMSPEQVEGKPIDPRSDIYSFGISCYHMLAGEPPFRGTTAFEVAVQHVQKDAVPLHELRPDLPADLCNIVHRMIAKNPEERYQTAREILRDLAKLREAIGAGTASNAAVSLSGIGTIRRTDSGTQTLTAPTTQRQFAGHKSYRFLLGMVAIVTAGAAGATLRWRLTSPPQTTAIAVTEPDPREAAQARFAEIEKALLKRIDDKDLKIEAAAEDVLDLVLLYIRERRIQAATDFLDSIPKRGPFQELGKGARPPEQWMRYHNQVVIEIGKGILLAAEDNPTDSQRHFLAALDVNRLIVKGKVSLSVPPGDAFLRVHPRWKKELADAIYRNEINLQGKPIDPLLDRYRTYAPKFTPPDKKP